MNDYKPLSYRLEESNLLEVQGMLEAKMKGVVLECNHVANRKVMITRLFTESVAFEKFSKYNIRDAVREFF